MKYALIFLFAFAIISTGHAQFTTFQKAFTHDNSNKGFGAEQTLDKGYVFTSLVDEGAGEFVALTKLDCKGEEEWTKTFGASGGVENWKGDVIEHSTGDYILMNNTGSFFSNNMQVLVARVAPDGTVLWVQRYGGLRNEVGRGLVETSDGHIAIAGSTASIGSDAFSTSYRDYLLMKVDVGTGELLWSKSFGNAGAIDDAYGLIEDSSDGSLIMMGRFLTGGFFYTGIVKTDADGNLAWIKSYGIDGHTTTGYGIINSSDGNYVITGSTTRRGVDWTSKPDPYVFKISPAGDVIWSKVFFPIADDNSDSGSSIVEDGAGNYAIAVPTMSYSAYTLGFVPNKHALYRISSSGDLSDAKLFNQGGSHYCRIQTSDYDGSYIMSGFTNYDAPNFESLIIKMDDNFVSGCDEINVLPETGEETAALNVVEPPYTEDTDLTFGSGPDVGDFTFTSIRTLCESFPAVNSDFEFSAGCVGSETPFTDLSTTDGQEILTWEWDFGDGESSTEQNPTHTYADAGSYEVTLTIYDGCEEATITYTVVITEAVGITTSDDVTIADGESADIWADGGLVYSWDPPDGLSCTDCPNPTAAPEVTTEYTVIIEDASGCKVTETILVTVLEEEDLFPEEGELFIPNVFSPNGDGNNDVLYVRGGPYSSVELMIFDRWGELVFLGEDQASGWDGSFRNEQLGAGVFVYAVTVTSAATGEKQEKKGTVTLMR